MLILIVIKDGYNHNVGSKKYFKQCPFIIIIFFEWDNVKRN